MRCDFVYGSRAPDFKTFLKCTCCGDHFPNNFTLGNNLSKQFPPVALFSSVIETFKTSGMLESKKIPFRYFLCLSLTATLVLLSRQTLYQVGR